MMTVSSINCGKHLISGRGVPSFVEKYILQSELRCAVLTRKKGVPKNKIGTPYRLSLKFILYVLLLSVLFLLT